MRENSRESLDYSQRNLLVVGNFKSSKGLFTLCEIQISNILCVFAAFSLSYPTLGIMILFKPILTLENELPRKLKSHFLAWKFRAASLRSMRGIN